VKKFVWPDVGFDRLEDCLKQLFKKNLEGALHLNFFFVTIVLLSGG
jgi:hypothetical protein